MLRALIWDVDGTLAETERDGHRVAFNRAFEDAGLSWRWDVETYGRLLRIAGGRERLLHDMGDHPDAPPSAAAREGLAHTLHQRKNALYASIVEEGHIALRPGVERLIDASRREGIALAVATTTSRANVVSLLTASLGERGLAAFDCIAGAEDAPSKKPDPLVYRIALDRLGIDASEAIAIEDSPNGLDAACAAGIATLLTRSDFFRSATFDGAAACCDDLDSCVRWSGGEAPRVDLDVLRTILAEAHATR